MRTTEEDSLYRDIEKMSVEELLIHINDEDKKVPNAVAKAIPQITKVVETAVDCVNRGGRIFYVGAGTSGRLGVLDASEILPTYGVDGAFIGIIAGGDDALRSPIEHAEDDTEQCWKDLSIHTPNAKDLIIGIAAGGTTPYVIEGVKTARHQGLKTACITCNANSLLSDAVEIPIEVVVGPEFVTGSTRMKSGTAQKLVLNMISTAVMVRIGRVQDNKMVDMKLSNNKLIDRGIIMIVSRLNISRREAKQLLTKYGSVRKVLQFYLE